MAKIFTVFGSNDAGSEWPVVSYKKRSDAIKHINAVQKQVDEWIKLKKIWSDEFIGGSYEQEEKLKRKCIPLDFNAHILQTVKVWYLYKESPFKLKFISKKSKNMKKYADKKIEQTTDTGN